MLALAKDPLPMGLHAAVQSHDSKRIEAESWEPANQSVRLKP